MAARYHLSLELLRQLWIGLQMSGGRQVQFNHPEFGGAGQWTPGKPVVSDIFNKSLKNKVDQVCTELATLLEQPAERSLSPDHAQYGNPFLKGVQNHVEYAYYPAARRLVVSDSRGRTVYDTASHQITGIAAISVTANLVFLTPMGTISTQDLKTVEQ